MYRGADKSLAQPWKETSYSYQDLQHYTKMYGVQTGIQQLNNGLTSTGVLISPQPNPGRRQATATKTCNTIPRLNGVQTTVKQQEYIAVVCTPYILVQCCKSWSLQLVSFQGRAKDLSAPGKQAYLRTNIYILKENTIASGRAVCGRWLGVIAGSNPVSCECCVLCRCWRSATARYLFQRSPTHRVYVIKCYQAQQ